MKLRVKHDLLSGNTNGHHHQHKQQGLSGRGYDARPLFKCHSMYLVVIGLLIIGVEVLFVYRHLGFYSSWRKTTTLSVDLGDWTPEMNFLLQGLQQDDNPRNNYYKSSLPPKPDGMLNGFPIYYHPPSSNVSSLLSKIHCIGETNGEPFYWKRHKKHVDMNWATRSCHFSLLCLDLQTHDFVVRLPRKDIIFPTTTTTSTTTTTTTTTTIEHQQTVFTNQSASGHPFGVSIGGLNTKWTHEGYPKLHWFPKVDYYDPNDRKENDSSPKKWSSFYTLPSNVTLIPFHSLAAFNPGHLVWDDFLPLYTLMQIFDLHETTDPLLIRYQLPGDGLWAGCDWKEAKTKDCEFMLKKFGPLMIRSHHHPDAIPFTTQHSLRLTLNEGGPPKSNLVCAKQGLAGLGALTDHGVDKGHGWEQKDYEIMYNQGRGGQLWRFRNFLLRNLDVAITTDPPSGPPYRIVFSEQSSQMKHRSMTFGPYVEALQNTDDLKKIIEPMQVQMKDYSLKEQAEMVGSAALYVTGCGGGAVTTTFLPRGASVLVFYSEVGGVENNKGTGKPARLDWDFFNNMAYAKVHWLTQPKGNFPKVPNADDLKMFVELIRHELNLLQAQQQQYV